MSELESTILEALLAGDRPELAVLREQARHASIRSRELTSAGFFLNFDLPATVPRCSISNVISDVGADIEGVANGAGFCIFLKGGALDFLEGFTYADPWPDEPRLLRWFYLRPVTAGSGDLVETNQRDLAYALGGHSIRREL